VQPLTLVHGTRRWQTPVRGMLTKLLWSTPLLLLLALASALLAQEPLITPETRVDYGILHHWLNGTDPRLIAWAADFARRRHDTKVIAEMPALLEHWSIPHAYDGGESQASQRRAVAAVLDTLIQAKAQVPIPAITAVAEFFPAQATILIARLPLSESRATLDDWTLELTGGGSGGTLARVASMMLAKDPGRSRSFWNQEQMGFVASVIAASEMDLRITVSSDHSVRGLGGTGGCGDFIGRALAPGWPQVYIYDLVENDPQAPAPIVVDLDGDRIASRRFEENRPWGSCNGVERLDPSTRHRLIAHWLGVQEKDVSWQPVEGFTIMWTEKAAYQRRLGEITEAQREKLHATVEALRQRGLLTDGEAATVSPRLIVTVQCEIDPCPLI
jgi:hypothetical protein